MIRTAAVLATALATGLPGLPAAAQTTLVGEWDAEIRRGNRIHLQLREDGGRRNSWGSTFEASELTGLNVGRLTNRRTEVSFELRRDAGTIAFEGRMDDEEGWGDYVFTPNPDFVDAMAGLGYDLSRRDVFSMTMVDISRSFVLELRSLGYRDVRRQDLIAMGIHGARPEFIREMAAAGFPNLPVSELLQFRIHGVSADFVGEMQRSGFDLDGRDLVQARIHGVSAEFAREMGAVGLRNLGFRDLIQFRIHGVSAELVRATRGIFPRATGHDLIQMRIHGVSPGFIRSMGELGYDDLRLDDLVQFRIHGVTGRYVREMGEAGFTDIRARDLIQMRIHGVTTAFAEEMNERYEDVTVRDLIDARIHSRRWVRRNR